MVSIPNGLPRPFSHLHEVTLTNADLHEFQSPTGFPGHLASTGQPAAAAKPETFQSPTGFPGHLAGGAAVILRKLPARAVSIPNGLPRPFSHAGAVA